MNKTFLPVMAAVLFSINTHAISPHTDHQHQQHKHTTQHQHGAHVHGLAELTVVIEGNILEINLQSPGANIVGFEHRATTTEQIRAVEKAKTALEAAAKLFVFIGNSCQLLRADADVTAIVKPVAHQQHKNHREHSHEHEHEHEHEHKNEPGKEDTHSEITAFYRFNCQQDSTLTAIGVNLFEHFPAIEELHVMWIANNQQGAVTLKAKSNTMYIR